MKIFMNDSKPVVAEEETEENLEVEEINNNIYFYTGVNKKSVFDLNKKLSASADNLVNISNALNIEVPELKIHINSGGGSLLDCFASVDYIRKCKAPVHTIVEGSAASAATLMSVVAKKRSITKHSFMLIHQLSAGMWGKFESMKDEIDNATMFMNVINDIYNKHTKIPKNVLKDILKRDIYMDAKTCLKYGLVDQVID